MGYLMELRKVIGNQVVVTAGVSVILVNSQKEVLLIHRKDNNYWGLPAGSIEINEDPRSAAIRELREETGVQLKEDSLELVQVFGGPDFFYRYPNGDQCSNVVISYYGNAGDIQLVQETSETDAAHWFTFEKLPLEIARHEKIILDYFQSYRLPKLYQKM